MTQKLYPIHRENLTSLNYSAERIASKVADIRESITLFNKISRYDLIDISAALGKINKDVAELLEHAD